MSSTPDQEPEPTRPSWKWAVIAVVGIAIITSVAHWQEVSEFAHLPQIEHALGIG